MKFLPFIVKNVLRHKARTLFTSLSIAVSLFLVVLLYAFIMMQDDVAEETKIYNRLVVTHVQGFAAPFPIAYLDRIRAMPGVKCAVPMSWFGGKYKDEKLPFAQFATDAKQFLDVMAEYRLPPEQLKAWQEDRTGCVVGRIIARNKEWKLGDKVVIKGDIYNCDLEFTVRGIYDGQGAADMEWLLFHFSYLDDTLKAKSERMAGNAGIVMLRADSAAIMPDLMGQIEERFASSDAPVMAMTERAFQQSFMAMMGNVRGFIQNTALAITISLICVAANAMAMSLRERTREIAVLKALGFGRPLVMGLFLSETMIIAVLGGILGSFGAKGLFSVIDLSRLGLNGMSSFYIPVWSAVYGVGLALVIGLLSGIIPAWRAGQVSVVDGLRKVV